MEVYFRFCSLFVCIYYYSIDTNTIRYFHLLLDSFRSKGQVIENHPMSVNYGKYNIDCEWSVRTCGMVSPQSYLNSYYLVPGTRYYQVEQYCMVPVPVQVQVQVHALLVLVVGMIVTGCMFLFLHSFEHPNPRVL